MSEFEMTSTW